MNNNNPATILALHRSRALRISIFLLFFTRPALANVDCVDASSSGCSTLRENGSTHWVGTWATAAVARPTISSAVGPTQQQQVAVPSSGSSRTVSSRAASNAPPKFNNQTVRQIVHVSIGGDHLRVVFSNAFGDSPLFVGAAHIALRQAAASVVPNTARALTFGGHFSATIAAGAVLLSDPVNLTVPAFADLAIDLYLPGNSESARTVLTSHNSAHQSNYVSITGNHSGTASFPVKETVTSWCFLSRVEVNAPTKIGAVVAFGDSITAGSRSTPNKNRRWPDFLAARLANAKIPMGVLNVGIPGNRILNDGDGVSALARFDRDALMQTGATHIIVLQGINDIAVGRGNALPSANDLIAGHRQLIARAHARKLKVVGATLTPYVGVDEATPEGEAKRQAINEWIRTSGEYDGVVDFDKAVRNTSEPSKLRSKFNSGDHAHMNDAGYEAMANAVDLGLFGR